LELSVIITSSKGYQNISNQPWHSPKVRALISKIETVIQNLSIKYILRFIGFESVRLRPQVLAILLLNLPHWYLLRNRG